MFSRVSQKFYLLLNYNNTKMLAYNCANLQINGCLQVIGFWIAVVMKSPIKNGMCIVRMSLYRVNSNSKLDWGSNEIIHSMNVCVSSGCRYRVNSNSKLMPRKEVSSPSVYVLHSSIQTYRSDLLGFDGLAALRALGKFFETLFGGFALGCGMGCFTALVSLPHAGWLQLLNNMHFYV